MNSNPILINQEITFPMYLSIKNVSQESIRVLIADDIPQVRQGLAILVKLASQNTAPQIEIIAEAKNGAEAIELTAIHQPDVVLMDLEMPVMDGFEATRRIKKDLPGTRVIILSIHAGPVERELARSAGAESFFEKSSPLGGLIQEIQGIHKNL
jgi:DNA-binding NarL/FixJ family response regulator